MSNHGHAVRHLRAAQACEEKGAMEAMGNSAVNRHGQRVEGGPGGQYTHQQTFSDAQFSVNVTSSGEVK